MSKPTITMTETRGGLRCAAVSDVGMRRTSNQDSLAISLSDNRQQWDVRGHLFVVADGMGAHAAGELASQIAVDTIPLAYLKRPDLSPADAIVQAVHDANGRIFAKGQGSVDFLGMGTTCSALLLLSEGALAAHVGDSRIYRLRGELIEQLTSDHSLVWEMMAAGQANEKAVPAYVPRNVITRSLGPHPTVKVDLEGPLPLQAGDRYLLCSDGLTGPLDAQLIGLVLAHLPPADAAQTLVDLSNLLGGPDNITVIVAEVGDLAHLGAPANGPFNASAPSSKPPAGLAPPTPLAAWGAAAACGVVGAIGWGLSVPWLAIVGLIGAVAAAAAGFVLQPRPSGEAKRCDAAHGQGPCRRHPAGANAKSIEMLSEIVRQLEDLEGQRDWPIDWQRVHKSRDEAHQAIAGADYPAAVIAYSAAVRTLMEAVRSCRRPPAGDSGIKLGVD